MKELFKRIKFNFINVLAFTVLTYCFGYLFYITSSRFPAERLKDIGDIKIAYIQIISLILGYFFVSSKKEQSNQNNNNTTTMSIKKAYYLQSSKVTGISGTPLANPLSPQDFCNTYTDFSIQTDADNNQYIEKTYANVGAANAETLQEVYGGSTINVISVLQGSSPFWLGPKPHRPF